MDKQFNVFFRNPVDTEAEWTDKNPVLLEGELAVVLEADGNEGDTRVKIGDGVSPFASLPFLNDYKISKDEVGVPNGVASLNDKGKVPWEQMPDFLERVVRMNLSCEPLVYTGNVQTPDILNYDPDKMVVSGDLTATDVGEYEISIGLKESYFWSDFTNDPITVKWKITPAVVSLPTCSNLTYTGSSQSPSWNGTSFMSRTSASVDSATNAGTYYSEFEPDSNHMWPDGTRTPKKLSWTILRAVIALPTCTSTLTYNGSSQSPTWSNTQFVLETLASTKFAVDAGAYYGEFVPDENHIWPDDTTGAKQVPWGISKANGILTISSTTVEITK